MSLWDWAVAAYARPDAAPACLALQDDHGQCVPYLLWAAWAGAVAPGTLADAAVLARDWETSVGGPLRGVRRALKVPDPARAALREDVKAVELAAERVLLETLEGLSAPRGGDAGQALAAAARAWSEPAPHEALERLARALS